MNIYADTLSSHSEQLKEISDTISGKETGKKGRPKTNGGKVDKEHLNMDFFSLVEQENTDFLIYTAQVKAVALKQVVKVVIVQDRNKEKKPKSISPLNWKWKLWKYWKFTTADSKLNSSFGMQRNIPA